MKKYWIYTLTNVKTGKLFYVGLTADFLRRFYAHKSKCKIRSVVIDMSVLETIETDDYNKAATLESYWIQQLKCWGFGLLNYKQTGIEGRYTKPSKYKLKAIAVPASPSITSEKIAKPQEVKIEAPVKKAKALTKRQEVANYKKSRLQKYKESYGVSLRYEYIYTKSKTAA